MDALKSMHESSMIAIIHHVDSDASGDKLGVCVAR